MDSKINKTIRNAKKAFALSLLDDCLDQMRVSAHGCGYALAVHGSLSNDIDIIAVPWTENASNIEALVEAILGTLRSYVGNATQSGKPTKKPHNRVAHTIVFRDGAVYIDLSVIKPLGKDEE